MNDYNSTGPFDIGIAAKSMPYVSAFFAYGRLPEGLKKG